MWASIPEISTALNALEYDEVLDGFLTDWKVDWSFISARLSSPSLEAR